MAQIRDEEYRRGRRQEFGRRDRFADDDAGRYDDSRHSAEGREREDMERFRSRSDQRQDFSRRRWDDDYQGDYAEDRDERGHWFYGDDEQFSVRQGQQRYNPGGSLQSERRGGEPDWRGVQRNYGTHYGKGPKGYQRSDDRIHEEICERLSDHHEIDASDIEVKVESGEVTLTGTVSERRAKRLAAELADGIRGVKDVHNQLRVSVGETSPTLAGSKADESARH